MHTNASPNLLTCDMYFKLFFFNTKIKFSFIKRKWGKAQVQYAYGTINKNLKFKKKKKQKNKNLKFKN